jgi:hypothetical protein
MLLALLLSCVFSFTTIIPMPASRGIVTPVIIVQPVHVNSIQDDDVQANRDSSQKEQKIVVDDKLTLPEMFLLIGLCICIALAVIGVVAVVFLA